MVLISFPEMLYLSTSQHVGSIFKPRGGVEMILGTEDLSWLVSILSGVCLFIVVVIRGITKE